MKRLLAVVIAVCYLCLSIGVTVHVHYCMGKIVGTSLIEQDKDHHCSHCGMNKTSSKKGCCKDEHKVYKSTNDQLITKALVIKANFCGFVPASLPAFPQAAYLTSPYKDYSSKANAPPRRAPDCPVYIRLRNFRV